ncbi:hypothetical protein Bca101_050053 [Brassica carinata]
MESSNHQAQRSKQGRESERVDKEANRKIERLREEEPSGRRYAQSRTVRAGGKAGSGFLAREETIRRRERKILKSCLSLKIEIFDSCPL